MYDFNPLTDTIPYKELLELDRWALHRLQELTETVIKSYKRFEYHSIYQAVYNFCVLTLSSFYLDILKDRLYTSPVNSKERRSAQTALNEILESLVRLVAPIIPFTADEAWGYLPNKERPISVHADLFIPVREEFKDSSLIKRWDLLLNVRKEVTKALEVARKDKVIGHSLDATVSLALPKDLSQGLEDYRDELRTICIVSAVEFVDEGTIEGGYESQEYDGLIVKVMPSPFPKCERCWIHDSTVGHDSERPTLCKRCVQVIKLSA
jgi:isoleucyl-tRNA synthetase